MAKRRGRRSGEEVPSLTKDQMKKQVVFLLGFLRPWAAKGSIALAILMFSSLVSLALPRFIGVLMDVVIGGASTGGFSLWQVAMAVVGVLLLQSTGRYFTSVMLATVSERSVAALRTSVFSHIIRLPMSFFAERRVGELASRMTSDLALIQETLTFSFLELVRQTLFFAGGVVLLMRQSLALTGAVLLFTPVLIAAAFAFGKAIRKYSTRTQDALAEATTIVEESLQAINEVKSFRTEEFESRRYSSSIGSAVSIAISGAKLRSAFVSFIIFTIFTGLSGIIWYAGTLVREGSMSIGDLTSYVLYAMFVAGAMSSIAEQYGQFQRMLGASLRVREILESQPEPTGTVPVKAPLNEVEFRNLTFCYPGREDSPALRDVSLRIPSGSRVAFVGESGAGKSTAIGLIQRFWEPSSGEVLWNGMGGHELSIDDVRHSVGTVPQDITLFGGTVADNIRYGRTDATDDEVLEAARIANALEFIEQFPEGFATVVGERGRKLSGGQRQRIAIARAVLKNPPILVLDEATSALDAATERLIQQAVDTLVQGRTTIIIAHRLSTVLRCDVIFAFRRGELVEWGTHHELVAKQGYYARLAALQLAAAERPTAEAEGDLS